MSLARLRFLAVSALVVPLAFVPLNAARAQSIITGRITSEGNAPLADARVLVIGTSQSATTGEDGKFTLRNVPAGSVELQALRVGYQSLKKSVNVTAGSTTVADFVMKQAIVQLDEVVT